MANVTSRKKNSLWFQRSKCVHHGRKEQQRGAAMTAEQETGSPHALPHPKAERANWNLKAHLQGHASSSKVVQTNPALKTALPTGNQVFQYLNLWGTFLT